jgi:polysaccharide pyruvyl transferase WcaK-like protein
MRVVTPIIRGVRLAAWAAAHSKPRVAYVGGWLGHDNLGDEALLEACRSLFPQMSLYPVRGHREEVALARITGVFQNAVLAGGTLINKNDGCLARAETMRDLAERCFVFGTGVANPEFWEGRKLAGGAAWRDNLVPWVDLLRKCDYVGVRGPLSQRILTDAGLTNVEVIGDPVLTFADGSRDMRYREKTLGLNVGVGAGHTWGEDEASVVKRLAELASFAKDAGWRVVWFVVWPKDYAVTHSAAKESGTEEHIRAIYRDHAQYLDLVSESSVFVGIKLHAVVLATCAGVPSIMLEYRPKCRDYMESIQQGHLCKRVDLVNAKDLWEQVVEIHGKRDEYARQMTEGISRLRMLQQKRARSIADSMGAVCAKTA